MDKETLLKNIQVDRPNQVIHEVISFERDSLYDVTNAKVRMETDFMGMKISDIYIQQYFTPSTR